MPKSKQLKDYIKEVELSTPQNMDYVVSLSNDKERNRFISRTEKVIRNSLEYKDYIQFLKEHVGLDSCIFFKNVTSGNSSGGKRSHISIQMHHEPFTLYDYVSVVLNKYEKEGLKIDDLDIADEVMKLHYENKVGLVPLSVTAHQMVHNSSKLIVPLNMCYGNYSEFLDEYEPYVPDEMYDKLERKMDMTQKLTPESFDALMKQFTYLDVKGVEEPQKMELEKNNIQIA